MIGYLKGRVLDHVEGKLLLGVGSDADCCIGYQLSVPQGPAYLSFKLQEIVELFIYTHVREDALELFGFASRSEKELFLTLLAVNGIGPKVALGILSAIEPGQLIQAILDGNKDALVRIPGIGKKTAERVVLELADSLAKKVEVGVFDSVRSSLDKKMGAGVSKANHPSASSTQASEKSMALLKDAKDALVGLGYREQEIGVLLNRVIQDQGAPKRVEDLIKAALQQMAQ
jgi:Holliday junction DNA helicase RuvA